MTEGDADPAVCGLTAPDPRIPLLVAGLRAAAVMNGAGEVALTRETRGGPVEWGGVYAEGIRLTGPCPLEVTYPEGLAPFRESLVELRASRAGVFTRHRFPSFELVQSVSAVEDDLRLPVVGRRVEVRPLGEGEVRLRLRASFQPFLAPVLLEGVKPYEYQAVVRGSELTVRTHGFALSFHADPTPARLLMDGAPWDGAETKGEIQTIAAEFDLAAAPGVECAVSVLVAGGFTRALSLASSAGPQLLRSSASWGEKAEARFSQWEAQTPFLDLPGLPEVETGYRLARGALRQLYAIHDPDLKGLVAGFPWYSAMWGRDLAWMLPAALWLGDADWVADSVHSIFRFQAHARIPILGASAGELPMQVSAGPIFLYGTSDTTLHYPDLVRRWVDHTGRTDLAEGLAKQLVAVGEWASRKVDPGTGLFVNGGEIARMRDATAEAGKVHYGFDAVDTTIWDSTDRRDHAVDVQVLYVEMLRALAQLARVTGHPGDAARYEVAVPSVLRALNGPYVWAEQQYLYDSLRRDGTGVDRLRPNALRAVSAGLLGSPLARSVVARVQREDLTTPWGVRTLSSMDPGFDPVAYHDGQVWPIATAWAAEAAFAVGDRESGWRYLRLIANRLLEERGFANECYRGDRDEPFDSCFLLGFSVAPFLTVLFERLWGISPRLSERTVRIEPALPDAPRSRLMGVRLGGGVLDLEYEGGTLIVHWGGPTSLTVEHGTQRTVLDAAGSATFR